MSGPFDVLQQLHTTLIGDSWMAYIKNGKDKPLSLQKKSQTNKILCRLHQRLTLTSRLTVFELEMT